MCYNIVGMLCHHLVVLYLTEEGNGRALAQRGLASAALLSLPAVSSARTLLHIKEVRWRLPELMSPDGGCSRYGIPG